MTKKDYLLENIDVLENIDEKYFSDMLKLLLTTQGIEKGLRTQFAGMFVNMVFNDDKSYKLSNSNVFREYPLNISSGQTKNIDLLFFDLDQEDDFVIGIENKFLGNDSEDQITDYYHSLKRLFPYNKIKIVYLTLDGREPKHNIESAVKSDLLCISWIDDILPMLDCAKKELAHKLNPQITGLEEVLYTLKTIKNTENTISKVNSTFILASYLKEMLNINDKKKWEISNNTEQSSYTLWKMHKKSGKSGKSGKKSKIKLNVEFYGHYYAVTYSGNSKFFIPVNLNIEQAKHLLETVCKLVLGIENENENENEKFKPYENKEINSIFHISQEDRNKMMVNEIKKYFESSKSKCK